MGGENPFVEENAAFKVEKTQEKFSGNIIAVRQDTIFTPYQEIMVRDIVEHFGSVAILAITAQKQIILIKQYRAAIDAVEWEIPAGLLDGFPMRTPWETARQELCEEVGLGAQKWSVLIDLCISPGISDEATRVFLAQELYELPQPQRREEERTITIHVLDLQEALAMIRTGEINNSIAVAAILAYATFGATTVRDPDSDFDLQPHALRRRKEIQ